MTDPTQALRQCAAQLQRAKALAAEYEHASRAGWRTVTEYEEELKRLRQANLDCVEHFNAVKAERDELLAALKPFVDGYRWWTEDDFLRAMANGLHPGIHRVHDALKAVRKVEA